MGPSAVLPRRRGPHTTQNSATMETSLTSSLHRRESRDALRPGMVVRCKVRVPDDTDAGTLPRHNFVVKVALVVRWVTPCRCVRSSGSPLCTRFSGCQVRLQRRKRRVKRCCSGHAMQSGGVYVLACTIIQCTAQRTLTAGPLRGVTSPVRVGFLQHHEAP